MIVGALGMGAVALGVTKMVWPKSKYHEQGKKPRADALNSQQMDFTAERLSGFSRNMIDHIFEEVDMDGSGTIELDEMPFLAQKMGEVWDMAEQKRIMEVSACLLPQHVPSVGVPCACSRASAMIHRP